MSLSTVGGNLPGTTTPPAITTLREEVDASDQDTDEEPRRMSQAGSSLEAPTHSELVALRQRFDEQKRDLEESHQQINRLQREVQGLRDQLAVAQAAAWTQAAAGADCESERQHLMAEAEHLMEQEQAAARRSEAVQAAAGRDEAVRHRAYRTLEEVAVQGPGFNVKTPIRL